jgi:ABC-type antimicrobial peptide transport system permease subunit
MITRGLSYGLLSARRRVRDLILPVVTTATGAFLLVQVLSLAGSVRRQAASLGNGAEVYRAVLLISVVVLLVGVVEVAVCATRTISQRTREIGVLGAAGVRRAPVVAALLVEPVLAALAGAVTGSVIAVVGGVAASAAGLSSSAPDAAGAAAGVILAIAVSLIASLLTSALPTWRAASVPPIRSLSSGG